MKKLINFLFFTITLLMFYTIPVISQNPPCYPEYIDLTLPVQKIYDFPPYSSSMPYDVLIGYIVADSIMKNVDYFTLRDFLKRQTYNDTIKYVMRYYYQMRDFDPIKFVQFINYDSVGRAVDPLSMILGEIDNTLLRVLPNKGDYLLMTSDIVVRIAVQDTLRRFDSISSIYKRTLLVSGLILDTIKGQVIPTTFPTFPNKISDSIYSFLPYPNLQFTYAIDWQRGCCDPCDYVMIGEDGYPWTGIKQKLINMDNIPWTVKGKEYIVFLSFYRVCHTSDEDYYTLFPNGRGTINYGMYPITDGIVSDPDNDFGFGTNIPIEQFMVLIKERIDQIKNFGR